MDRLKSKAFGWVRVTDTLTVVGVVVAPRGEPVTMTLYEPTATEDATPIVRELAAPEDDGVREPGLKELHEMPDGRGVTHDSVTGTAVPAVRAAVIVTVPELPVLILTGPLFDNE